MEDSIIIRNKPASLIEYNVTSSIMDSIRASDMKDWHSVSLENLFISTEDNVDIDIYVERGFDTRMQLQIRSNPDESVDRLTDFMINNIKQTVRDICINNLDIPFDDNEKISSLRIKPEIGHNDNPSNKSYIVRFDTEKYESDIIEDHKMSGNPRISGRRVLVSQIQSMKVHRGMSVEEIVEELDHTITEAEVESAIEFAEKSDDIDIEKNEESGDSETVTFSKNDIKEHLDDMDQELPDIQDNR